MEFDNPDGPGLIGGLPIHRVNHGDGVCARRHAPSHAGAVDARARGVQPFDFDAAGLEVPAPVIDLDTPGPFLSIVVPGGT